MKISLNGSARIFGNFSILNGQRKQYIHCSSHHYFKDDGDFGWVFKMAHYIVNTFDLDSERNFAGSVVWLLLKNILCLASPSVMYK